MGYANKRVAELKTGDQTPWYEVTGEPVEDAQVPGWFRVPVRHFDSERDGHVRSQGAEQVPVELSS